MKISTEIGSAAAIVGEEKTLEYLGKAGFDAWDFSMFAMCRPDYGARIALPSDHPLSGPGYLAYARKLKQVGLDNGLVCSQSHAPFPTGYVNMETYLKRAIECTAEAGGNICVIHPMNDASARENARMYHKLLPFAKDCGVIIAAENMWNWDREKDISSFAACATSESFLEHLQAVGGESFAACLDIGHAEMAGSGSGAVSMIKALGHHLQALHIHDNDLWRDRHQLPFTMKIDFSAVLGALKEIGYKGYLTLEADRYLTPYTPETVCEGIGEMAAAAKKLSALYEAL